MDDVVFLDPFLMSIISSLFLLMLRGKLLCWHCSTTLLIIAVARTLTPCFLLFVQQRVTSSVNLKMALELCLATQSWVLESSGRTEHTTSAVGQWATSVVANCNCLMLPVRMSMILFHREEQSFLSLTEDDGAKKQAVGRTPWIKQRPCRQRAGWRLCPKLAAQQSLYFKTLQCFGAFVHPESLRKRSPLRVSSLV